MDLFGGYPSVVRFSLTSVATLHANRHADVMSDQPSHKTVHPQLAVIRRYYEGCNTGDVVQMVSCFTTDVVHYFVDHAPVRGAEALAGYWATIGPRTRAAWSVDHFIAGVNEAVIEWSMRWTPSGGGAGEEEVLRGTEWFRFEAEQISEIRSYHANHYLSAPQNRELHGFPYAERGYTPA